MKIKYSILLILLIFLSNTVCSCKKETNPVSSPNQIYQTAYGTVTQIDSYPLYSFNYTADYEFDEYLQTGVLPQFASNQFMPDNFCCTCFSAFGGDNRFFGRNYDWPDHTCYYVVLTNPDNAYASISTVDLGFFNYDPNQSPNNSSNQNTLRLLPYWPFDGINEKGVAVGMNALPESEAPYNPTKVTIGELQLIRLVLDYAASTEEAITLIRKYNIRMETPPIHYLIADISGHSAIVEFVDGEMVIIKNSNPWQVTTNFIISSILDPYNYGCWRYQAACTTLSNKNGILSENEVMYLLQTVSVSSTRWSSVFDIINGQVKIAMDRDYDYWYTFTISSR